MEKQMARRKVNEQWLSYSLLLLLIAMQVSTPIGSRERSKKKNARTLFIPFINEGLNDFFTAFTAAIF